MECGPFSRRGSRELKNSAMIYGKPALSTTFFRNPAERKRPRSFLNMEFMPTDLYPPVWVGHSCPTSLPKDVVADSSKADRSVRSTQLMQKANLRGHKIQRPRQVGFELLS